MIFDFSGGKLNFFKSLYQEARDAYGEELEAMERRMKQYLGDKEIDSSSVPATHIRNITYELIESQVTGYIPSPIVSPKKDGKRGYRNAKSIETLCRRLRNDLPFERINDQDERSAPTYGASIFLLEWDESVHTHNTTGDVRVTCLTPEEFIPQPNVYSDVNDMQYCFARFETTKEEIVARYGVKPSVAEDTESDETAHDDGYTATVYVCYYRNAKGKISKYAWSGETELQDEDDFYARRVKVCQVCGKRDGVCHCDDPRFKTVVSEYEELTEPITLSDGTIIPVEVPSIKDGEVLTRIERRQSTTTDGQMVFDGGEFMVPVVEDVPVAIKEPTRLPYYTPDMFPIVIRKNVSKQGSLYGQSDCDVIRPQQQAINKLESRIMQKLLRSAVTPVLPDDASISPENTIFGQVIRMHPGQSASQYGIVDTTPDIQADVMQSERCYEQAKLLLGISASFQGQPDPSAQSGRAKQLQIQQAAGRLDSKRRMKNAAYADIDKVIFQLYLAYSDEPRPAVYTDSNGVRHNVEFNRYDFLLRDEAGKWYYDDQYMFSTDPAIDIEESRPTLWEENLKSFQMGAFGDLASPETLLIYWRNMERAHYPYARENVERFEAQVDHARQLAEMEQRATAAEADLASHIEYEALLQNELGGIQNGSNKVSNV